MSMMASDNKVEKLQTKIRSLHQEVNNTQIHLLDKSHCVEVYYCK